MTAAAGHGGGRADAPLLLAFPDDAEVALARAVADALAAPLALLDVHRFPDGETRLRLPPRLPPHCVLLRGLQDADTRVLPLLLAAAGARELGAVRLTLLAPYLAYMRQDMAFSPGEVVSQRHLGRLLAGSFDALVTVDPHLHRVASLDEVLPGRRGAALSAAGLLGRFVAAQRPGALLLGPDAESAQWVGRAAAAAGLDAAVCGKTRRGDHDVAVALPAVDVRGRAVVLLDDVASTGRTLAAAARGALQAGAASVDAAVTHALFVGDALAQVHAAGVGRVWSSDCVPHASNAVGVAGLLAAAVQGLLAADGRAGG